MTLSWFSSASSISTWNDFSARGREKEREKERTGAQAVQKRTWFMFYCCKAEF
jgi:hypothetical protein